MKLMCATRLLILLLFFCRATLTAQDLVPPIQNYRVVEYHAASKNWGLSANMDGELFAANNGGLLHFNGQDWKLYKLPNKTTIRSVLCVGNKIYTGSYEEFGFWQKNEVGLFQYTSLTHLIKNHEFTSEEFWQILSFDGAIWFRSFSGVYRFQDDEISVLNPPFVVTSMALHGDRLLAAGGHQRLYALQGESFVPFGEHSLLDGKVVVAMSAFGKDLLIGTKLHGCYVLRDNELIPFNTTINEELQKHQLNQILFLKDGRIAFGTIKNGIYLYDPGLDNFQRLGREVGLQNNTVLSLLQYDDHLWAGLDNGIDRIQLNHPLSFYTDYSGTLGAVYDLAFHQGSLFVGSNTGIYYFDKGRLKFVEGSQGHVWDLQLVGNTLLCGHNTGTFKVDIGNLEQVSSISGGYAIVKIPERPSTFLQGTYTGIARYREENGQWSVKAVSGISFPVKYLSFEDRQTLWAAHPYKGLYRLKLNESQDSVLHIQEFKNEVIASNYNVKLFNVKNQIVLYSEGNWYTYNPISGEIESFTELQAYNNKDLVHFSDPYFWFIDNEGNKEVICTDLKGDHFVLADSQLQRRLLPESENIIKQNDSIYYLTLSDGFGRLNMRRFKNILKQVPLPSPKLNSFEDSNRKYELNAGRSFEIPFKYSRELSLRISTPGLANPKYFYDLKGKISQSEPLNEGVIRFYNLPYGDYELSVFTVNPDNEQSAPNIIQFYIAPPWYLSEVSVLIYLLMAIGTFFLIRLYNKRKLERKHAKLKLHLQREQEEHIARLEKDKLEREVKLKQNELTNITMNVAKKNELILELKNLLLMNKEKFGNQQRYRLFMKKLNKSIDDKEDWKRFEVNFKELHNDFFETLLVRYPKLTPKDLRLCAYLKMNLSSKEIAPLMGITTRGVEIHRYRLRKKLKIDGSQNISNFLITLR